ncbi:hypothetical protein [Undibacterium macrobrachii]|uniref:Uncharacterized protein n=1 Tax=Undibacterium macrobrachii TaxID=1119058 RepID=A0ABQ2X650_9BURK|nr:hypothetical protein [Undibacterium macrobrachii]GGX01596.1 hypothetical protein GCM10011282_04420 [Undibacterium macrobrachii]
MIRRLKSAARDLFVTALVLAIAIAFGYMGEDQLNDQLLSESVLADIKNSGSTEILDHQDEMVAIAKPTANAEVSR